MIATILDTETTGLLDNRTLKIEKLPEVIEFFAGVADLKTGKVSKKFTSLIKPKNKIPEEVIHITGLTDELVKDAPRFAEVADQIQEIIEGSRFIIAHNASYDREMLDIEFERLGRKLAWPRCICTVEQTIHIKGYRFSQTELHQYLFDEPFPDAHRAEPDTMALIRCCVELHKRGIL